MLIILRLLLPFLLLFFLCLHPLYDLFFLLAVSEGLQHIDRLYRVIGPVFQRVFHPSVGLSAHIDKEIGPLDLGHVRRTRPVTVQIDAALHQIGYIKFILKLTHQVHHPVILRICRTDDPVLFLPGFRGFFLPICPLCRRKPAARKYKHGQNRHKQQRYHLFFHLSCRSFLFPSWRSQKCRPRSIYPRQFLQYPDRPLLSIVTSKP